jgi:hypothetical protein
MGLGHKSRIDDMTMVQLARDYGLRGVVLKSHFWPTMDRAFHLNERLASETFTVFSSITLNPVAGALSPMSVEAAAGHGAKLVYLPTWGACHDHQNKGVVFQRVMQPNFPAIPEELDKHGAISMLDENGKLLPAVHDIIALCKQHQLVLCTGHVSSPEAMLVLRAAHAAGVDKLVATHPFSPLISTSIEDAREYARLGAILEFTFAGTVAAHKPLVIRQVADLVRELGPQHCMLTTDVFFEYLPPQPEALRMFAHQMCFVGIPEEDVRTMIVSNPTRLLGLAA